MEKISQVSLLQAPIPSQKGQLFLESQVFDEKTGKNMPAKLYEKCIVINANNCILYNFDVKFTIEEQSIQFQHNEKKIKYSLPKNDSDKWLTVLKLYLNQRGFQNVFKPIKKIGKGNFASVFLVQKKSNGNKFAVKAFSKQAAYSEENGKQCLIKQIDIMRHLDHKNTMKLMEVFESQNSLYIVFQLLQGGQMDARIKQRKKFTQSEIRQMVHSLLQGLCAMHAKGIMHRDLKPENILFRNKSDNECVIADFGLAQFTHAQNYLFVRCGTPGFVAPEVINIRDMKTKYSPICDIFSLGLIFHVLLFGKSIFPGSTYNEILKDNRACDFKFDDERYKKIDQSTLDLLKKMLAVDPKERITASSALNHQYFNTIRKRKSNEENIINLSGYGQNKPKPGTIIKDSLPILVMGKENVMTGNTNTVGQVTDTKFSIGGIINLGQKVSFFKKRQ